MEIGYNRYIYRSGVVSNSKVGFLAAGLGRLGLWLCQYQC